MGFVRGKFLSRNRRVGFCANRFFSESPDKFSMRILQPAGNSSLARQWPTVLAINDQIDSHESFLAAVSRQKASVAFSHSGTTAVSKLISCGVISAKPSSHRPAK